MVLVVGSTGYVGSEVCRLLLDQGHSVRAMVRHTTDAGKVQHLQALGAEIVLGDLRDPASLAAACAGVDAVISTASATAAPDPDNTVLNVDGAGQIALMDAAAAASVRHFVFVSFSGNLDVDTPLSAAKRGAEEHLRTSGMRFTVLRPSAFMEVWLSPVLGFDVPNGRATVYGSGGAPVSYVSFADVARFCVEALRNEAAWNRTLEIGGPEPLTPLQAVRIAEQVTGRSMEVQHVPEEVLRGQYESAQDPLQKSFAGLMLNLAQGDTIDMDPVQTAFPLQLRSVRDFMGMAYAAPHNQAMH
jgi:uncharacterized protein YbjT (DUF2867 family)